MAFNPRLSSGGLVVGGPAADDAAASGNPVPVGGIYNSTLPTYTAGDRTQLQSDTRGGVAVYLKQQNGTATYGFLSTAFGDAGAFPNALAVGAYNGVFSGSAWDSMRRVANATDSTGTGIAAAGILAQYDDTSPSAVTENQFGNLRMGADRVLLVRSEINTAAATELTRTADANAYAIGDQIASTTVAGDVTPLQLTVARKTGGTGRVSGAQLMLDSATAFGAIRLHLFNTTPFTAGGFQADNSALALTYTALKTGSAGANPNYLGFIDFETFTAQSASATSRGSAGQTDLNFTCAAASQVIFGLLEARAVFTPANAGKFNVTLDIVQD